MALLIDQLAMAEGDDQHEQAVILDPADDPVIADTVTPQPGQVARQGIAK